ncbi:BofC N-terminal domain-containing protein [Cytobacillus oceanisediminis]|uniref:BofC N-terminal domain-containing protein n=1 Tax=Cytobacillus oceanisediminis TaxID=665099 RepID=UPI002816571D|nr:BofC N-terminal domain-containing protein [Cytobacillus oceanisediminis]
MFLEREYLDGELSQETIEDTIWTLVMIPGLNMNNDSLSIVYRIYSFPPAIGSYFSIIVIKWLIRSY